ncbi:MAG: MFS transporter [Proteobacteria bacterium]|nr:MFS transporter [Pseudomonadota bacterium]
MPGFGRDTLQFLRDNARWLAGAFLLTMFSSFGQTFFIGLSGEELRARFDLSSGGFGGLYMLATLASAISLPWLGRTLDLMPGWKVVRFTMPAFALACVLITVAPNVAVLGLALYLLRLFGQGMMTETAYTETGRWFVANRGRAMALIVIGQQVGLAALPVLVVLIGRASGSWRTAWIASAALLVLVGLPAIVALLRVERVPRSHEAKVRDRRTARDWTRAQVLRDPILYLLLLGTLAPPFISTVIFFHQDYLIALRGYDPLAFAAAFPVMSVTTVVFGLACGHLIDRIGALRLLPFYLIPLAVASAAVALITPVWGVYVFMFLLGISSGFTSTLFGALWPEVYGLANLGGIRAIIVAAMVLATALGPGVSGALIDRGISLPQQMLWLSAWCVAACFVLGFSARQVRAREKRPLLQGAL